MDRSTEEESASGTVKSTNQNGEGTDAKQATGKVVFEREFVADFAADLPWHHDSPITALSDADKHQLAELVTARAGPFEPGFADIYRSLEGKEGIRVAEIKKAKCLDKAYAAGIRVAAPTFEQLDFVVTGGPEVLVQRKSGALYDLGGGKGVRAHQGRRDADVCRRGALHRLSAAPGIRPRAGWCVGTRVLIHGVLERPREALKLSDWAPLIHCVGDAAV